MKKLKLIIAIFSLILPVISYSQIVDSLELPFMHLSPEEKLNTFLQLAEENQTKDVILAIRYARKSLTLAEELNKESELAKAYKSLGILYSFEADYARAYEFLLEALNKFQHLGDTINIVQVRIAIGDIYYDLKKYKEARDYYLESLKLTTDPDLLATIYCNIGNTYFSGEDEGENEAYNYYMKALQYKTLVKNQRSISDTYTGLAIFYENQGKYDEAMHYYQSGLEIEKAANDKVAMISSYLNIGDLLRKMKKYDQALAEIQKGIQLAREWNLRSNILQGYKMMGVTYDDMGDFQKAYKWMVKATFLQDSIFTSDLTNKVAEARTLYELDLKDAKIRILEKENSVLFWQRGFYLTAAILALLAIITSYVFYKRKVKFTDQLKAANTELEGKNIKLLESERTLKELVKAKDRYLSVLAHDLRSPFQGLMGVLGVLNKDFETMHKSEVKEFLVLVENSLRNLFDLLDNLLQWSKMHTGTLESEKTEVSLSKIIDEIVEIYQQNAMLKNVVLMPDLQENIKIYASENMLRSIIRNLISNAIKFTPQGGYVKVKALKIDDSVEIRVSDTGIGISKENLKKLFTDEKISSEGTEREKGSGLGLVLTKEFVELHKGTIEVKSEEGKGTEFIVVLPLK